MTPKQQVAQALLKINAVGFSPQKPITFKSGIVSPVYVDNRQLPYYPHIWRIIIQNFRDLIEKRELYFEIIAGVAVGGVPHSSALAYIMERPAVFVRKESKEHGRKQQVEGGDVTDRYVLLVEDLVTTGGSSLEAVHKLRAEHALVKEVVAIVSYGFAEATTNFEQARVRLHTLTDFTTILAEARTMDKFSAEEHDLIADWFNDPYGWAGRHNLA